jgi:hypothetical protein
MQALHELAFLGRDGGKRIMRFILGVGILVGLVGAAYAAMPVTVESFDIDVGQVDLVDVAAFEDGNRAVAMFDNGLIRLRMVDADARAVVGPPEGEFDQRILPEGGAVVGRKLYISSWFQLVVIDLDTKEVTTLHAPPFSTRGFVPAPVVVSSDRNRVYTISASDLLAVDTASQSVVALTPLEGEHWYVVAISPDDREIYVADGTTGVLSRFDAADLSPLGASSFVGSSGIENGRPDLGVAPDGRIYVGYQDTQPRFNVSVLERSGALMLTKVYDFVTYGMDLTPDGAFLITGSGEFIDRESLDVVGRARTGRNGGRLHVTRDGRRAFVANRGSTFVTVIDITSFPLAVPIDIGATSILVHPNGIDGRVLSVAILSLPGFDATTVVPGSVCFGSAEHPEARACGEAREVGPPRDLDGDGDIDLLLRFRAASSGLAPGDTEACLTGETTAGVRIAGCDALQVRSQ